MLASKLLAIALLALLPAVQSRHFACSWQPNRNQPASNGFYHYCSSQRDGSAYKCEAGSEGAKTVASFGYIGAGILNLSEQARPAERGSAADAKRRLALRRGWLCSR